MPCIVGAHELDVLEQSVAGRKGPLTHAAEMHAGGRGRLCHNCRLSGRRRSRGLRCCLLLELEELGAPMFAQTCCVHLPADVLRGAVKDGGKRLDELHNPSVSQQPGDFFVVALERIELAAAARGHTAAKARVLVSWLVSCVWRGNAEGTCKTNRAQGALEALRYCMTSQTAGKSAPHRPPSLRISSLINPTSVTSAAAPQRSPSGEPIRAAFFFFSMQQPLVRPP